MQKIMKPIGEGLNQLSQWLEGRTNPGQGTAGLETSHVEGGKGAGRARDGGHSGALNTEACRFCFAQT